MSYRCRLRIEKLEEEAQYIEVMQVSQTLSFGNIKSDYKIVEGNRIQGIEQGIGLITAGRSISFKSSLFEIKRLTGEDDIYKAISKYTSLLTNNYIYQFYIEQYIDGVWYSCRVQMQEIDGYSIEIINMIKSFGFKCVMIDNFYWGEEIKEDIGLIGSGLQRIKYFSKSLVPTPICFEWHIQGQGPTLSAWVVHNENYGIVFNTYIGSGEFTLVYNGEYLLVDGEYISFEGVQPILDIGENEIIINSSYNTVSFKIKYNKGISL